MSINLDIDLINDFRDKINEELHLQESLRNVEGKNHWNVICSAMDWITVASEGLPEIKLNKSSGIGYNHIETINLMQYIITADILVESIIQLYRVMDRKKPYPLKESKEVFKQSKLSDDQYFKHLRAVFSTHPVNLNSVDGVKKQDGEKFFASWVSRDLIDYDFIVFLYSNNPEKDEAIPLGINVQDINLYTEYRYNLLHDLILKIKTLSL